MFLLLNFLFSLRAVVVRDDGNDVVAVCCPASGMNEREGGNVVVGFVVAAAHATVEFDDEMVLVFASVAAACFNESCLEDAPSVNEMRVLFCADGTLCFCLLCWSPKTERQMC